MNTIQDIGRELLDNHDDMADVTMAAIEDAVADALDIDPGEAGGPEAIELIAEKVDLWLSANG